MPSIEDFKINAKDIENYNEMVRQYSKQEFLRLTINSKVDIKFYESIAKKLDTFDSKIVEKVLLDKGGYSTSSCSCTFYIHNEHGEVLDFQNRWYLGCKKPAWLLPWQCQYNGLRFNCYSLDLSRFIKDCMPDEFYKKDVFDNALLIENIADYLYKEEMSLHYMFR